MHDDAQLVCEGVCNPSIRDYDATTGGLKEGNRPVERQSVIADFVRTLKHTTHISISGVVFRSGNWCKEWVCADCGHHRVF